MTGPDRCHIADITLRPGETRDAIILLIDVHAVLDHLIGEGHDPELAARADGYLHYADSDYATGLDLLAGRNALSYRLTTAMRDAIVPPAGTPQ